MSKPKKKARGKVAYCHQPDHDGSPGWCGHPLPCPYHTVVVDLKHTPALIAAPAGRSLSRREQERLAAIAEALSGCPQPLGMPLGTMRSQGPHVG
jgi:hypothetical protein